MKDYANFLATHPLCRLDPLRHQVEPPIREQRSIEFKKLYKLDDGEHWTIKRVQGVHFPGEAGYQEPQQKEHEPLKALDVPQGQAEPLLRFRLKLGPDRVYASCLTYSPSQQETVQFDKEKLQSNPGKKIIDRFPEDSCIYANDLRHCATAWKSVSLFQHGITIIKYGNDDDQWMRVLNALKHIYIVYTPEHSSVLISAYTNLIEQGKLISWQKALPGMELHHVGPYFSSEKDGAGYSGVVARNARKPTFYAEHQPFGIPHIDAEPSWLHSDAIRSIQEATKSHFHMFITFNIWVAIGRPAENQTLAVRAWNPWVHSALQDFLRSGGSAFDMREPEHYYGLRNPTLHEFIVILQHTSLRPHYEGVSHFGATLVDNQGKPLPAEHPRQSCEARMVVSFRIKGEVTQRPSSGKWGCYKHVWGQTFYANDETKQTAWMPDDKKYFPGLSDPEWKAVHGQLTHPVRPKPISYEIFRRELDAEWVIKIY